MAIGGGKPREVRLKTPVSDQAIAGLGLGDVVYLDGIVYTGREGSIGASSRRAWIRRWTCGL